MAPPPGPQGPGAPGAAPGGFGDPIGQAGPTGHTGYPDPVGHPDPLSGPNAPGGPGSGPTGPGGPGAGADPFGYHPSRPSQLNRPAEVLGEEPGRAPFPPGPASPFPQGPAAPSGGPGAPDGPGAAHGAFAQQPSSTPTQQRQPPSTDDWMLPPPAQSSSPFPQGPGQPEPGHRDPGAAPGGHPSPGYPSPGTWTAVIGPDRAYFTAMMQRSGPDADGLNLPAYAPEQSVPLSGGQLTIGRRRQSTGEAPDIDLSVPPEDPGVSHKHAVLMRQADGSWAVIDQNSTNGTTLNGGEEPIQPYVPVPLNDGDRVHVGAWTTITIRRD
ncbi:FHA domain protein [Streptomyces clavuligerus]|uniref:FHA domain protein n=2 Tax=Streptomyces clavuligerus TaxID=1901 RepID=E2Q3U4_STRCL|nr:FHA domain protein [Streptomyces clavuligerus]